MPSVKVNGMNELLYTIMQTIINIVALICVAGYGVYQLNDNVKTWEKGVSKFLLFGVEFLYEGFSGNIAPWKSIAERYMLENDEVLELVDSLQGSPYEKPVIELYNPNYNGMSVYRIEALGVCERYKTTGVKELEAICKHIIKGYFTKTRKVPPYIHISLVTEKKLRFEIALSEAVKNKFDEERREIERYEEQNRIEQKNNSLEEEIELGL